MRGKQEIMSQRLLHPQNDAGATVQRRYRGSRVEEGKITGSWEMYWSQVFHAGVNGPCQTIDIRHGEWQQAA